jgi:signal recognition particle subunit SRP54
MTGQDAVTVAGAFNEALDITGVVLSKMDGDARGGAALSIKATIGKNVKFVGVGEKISEFEPFMPERVAGRILGMGDMLTLIEKAQSAIEADEAQELARKFQKAEFNLEDFRVQMRRMKKLGSLEGLLKLVPGMGALKQKLGEMSVPDKDMVRVEAMINSMTKEERRNPKIINAGRKQRIAKGSGSSTAQVNQLLKQFDTMRSMMQRLMGGGGKLPKGIPGAGMPVRFPGAGMYSDAMGAMPGMAGGAVGSEQEQKKLRQKRKEERKRKKQNRK